MYTNANLPKRADDARSVRCSTGPCLIPSRVLCFIHCRIWNRDQAMSPSTSNV